MVVQEKGGGVWLRVVKYSLTNREFFLDKVCFAFAI